MNHKAPLTNVFAAIFFFFFRFVSIFSTTDTMRLREVRQLFALAVQVCVCVHVWFWCGFQMLLKCQVLCSEMMMLKYLQPVYENQSTFSLFEQFKVLLHITLFSVMTWNKIKCWSNNYTFPFAFYWPKNK